MPKITKLTPEQEADLPVFRQKYLDAALSGKRADRENLSAAISDAYVEIGQPPPVVVVLQSPLQAMMAIRFMQAFAAKETGGQLRDQLWDQLGGQLGGQLWGQLGDQLGGQLGGQLRGQLRGQPIWNDKFLFGSQDLYWVAWAKFAERIGVEFTDQMSRRLEIMRRIGFECEWWWPYEGFCFVSERPVTNSWDESRRLHNADGPTVMYADGYSLYAWHGIRVPGEWIKDRSLTPSIALSWENVEQRRAACEILGWSNVLQHSSLNPRIIDEDEPYIGTLIEVDLPDAPGQRFLKYQCGTGRWFAESVNDKSFDTALKANAGGNGYRLGNDDPDQFIPFLRT